MSEAGGADDGSPVNDFTEEPGEQSPQMRLEAVSPRTAVMCPWLQTWRFFYFLRCTNIVYLLSSLNLGHFSLRWEVFLA